MAARIPPQNLEAEKAILGSLMLDKDAWDKVVDQVDESDFYKPAHQRLFAVIRDLNHKRYPVDLITVSDALRTQGDLEMVGGTDVLVDLVNSVISSVNIEAHSKLVKEKSTLRKMISAGSEIVEKAFESDFQDVDSFISEAEGKFFKLNEKKDNTGLLAPMSIVSQSIRKISELAEKKMDITGVSTGFTFLDKMTSGLHGGELIILAARPSMGKTAFSLNIAQHAALRQKKTVAYFSCEMSRESVMMRILASEARINIKDIRSGRIPDHAWTKLIETAGHVSESGLYIDETSSISPFEVRARCRRLKSQVGLDLIVIDYLQLMKMKTKVESREREVSEISMTLKAIAKELDVPVVALAQLNRGVEGRTDKRPMLSDLRESGSIEQDADVIMMLYRDDYYEKDDQDKAGRAEVIIGKQRNGPTGTVHLKFEAEFNRFKDSDPMPMHPVPPPPPVAHQQSGSGQAPSGKPRNFAPGASV